MATCTVPFLVDLEPLIHAVFGEPYVQPVLGSYRCDLTLDFIGSGNVQIAAEFLLSHFKTRGQGGLAIVDQVDLLPHIDKSILAVQPVGDISGLAVHHPSHVGDSVEHRIGSPVGSTLDRGRLLPECCCTLAARSLFMVEKAAQLAGRRDVSCFGLFCNPLAVSLRSACRTLFLKLLP